MLGRYWDWLRRHPVWGFLSAGLLVFAAISTIRGGLEASTFFYQQVSDAFRDKYADEYSSLGRLNAGLTLEYVESIFGTPELRKAIPAILREPDAEGEDFVEWPTNLDGYSELIYVEHAYFLQLIVSPAGEIEAYAVTSRRKDFRPELPLGLVCCSADEPEPLKLRLNQATFAEIAPNGGNALPPISEPLYGIYDSFAEASAWGMLPYYFEYHYRGNPGFYRSYYLGLTPSGYLRNGSVPVPLELAFRFNTLSEDDIRGLFQSLSAFRATEAPNTFVVTGVFADTVIEYFNRQGVGPNYYDIREFP